MIEQKDAIRQANTWYLVIPSRGIARTYVRQGQDWTEFAIPVLSPSRSGKNAYSEYIGRKLNQQEIGQEAARFERQVAFRLTYQAL